VIVVSPSQRTLRIEILCSVFVLLSGSCGRLHFEAGEYDAIDANSNADGSIRQQIGCRSPEVQGEFTSDFESDLPQRFVILRTGESDAMVSGGTVNIIPSPNDVSYVYILSPDRSLLRRRFMIETVKMVDTNQQVSASMTVTAGFDRRTDIVLFQSAGDLVVQSWDGAAYVINSQRRYDAVADRWWQIREQGGTLFFETSSDGEQWKMFVQVPTPAWMSNAYFDLGAGTRVSFSNTLSRGQMQFDNLFDCIR
jgi:hypothetical protein